MKVLDVGSGAGDVALVLADLVGPEGRVVGIDANEDILDTARARVRAVGWATVSLRHGTIDRLDLDTDFDAVVGRWVLMYQPDPAALLRQARALLGPGGIVAFQEGDLRNGARLYPSAPLHEQLARWLTPPPHLPGPDLEMGPKLFGTFVEAGLPAPRLSLDAPVGGGPAWPGYAYLTETARSLLPLVMQATGVTREQFDLDTLEDRLRAEAVEQNAVQILPSLYGAWART
jgi:SAM-dependent methyltransferase